MSSGVSVTGRLRAYLRIALFVLAMCWYLGRLLIAFAVKGATEQRGFLYRRKFNRAAMAILGVRCTVHGRQSAQPVLYVSNHRSLLDPIIQLRYIDTYIVSKAEVEQYPLIGRGARETGVIFVKRDSRESRMASREAIRNLLKNNKSVLIYPEGTTSDLSTTRDFRMGAFEIAAELKVPVVPIAIRYTDPNDSWADGPMLPFFIRKFAKNQTHAQMWIGTPISSDDATVLMQKSREWINQRLLDKETLSVEAG